MTGGHAPGGAPVPTPAAPVGKARLEALCDGVFAIVMTLLVLEIVPHDLPPGMNDAALRALFAGLGPKVVSYVISFVVVAIFWVGHHAEFAHIRRTDRRHLWIAVLVGVRSPRASFALYVAAAAFYIALQVGPSARRDRGA